MKTSIFKSLDDVFHKAMDCNDCALKELAELIPNDIPQPRWVGPNFENENIKIVVLMLNPGSGAGYKIYQGQDNEHLQMLKKYKNHECLISEYLDSQLKDMENWGKGKFIKFYRDLLDLDFDRISFANLAWCATSDNSYPMEMLENCFSKHTKSLLSLLNPDVVLLSGTKAWEFSEYLTDINPNIHIIKTFHFANRMSNESIVEHTSDVRGKLSKLGYITSHNEIQG